MAQNNRFIKVDGAFTRPEAQMGAKPNPFLTGDYTSVTDPVDAFNMLTLDLLKKAQSGDTMPELQQQERALQRTAIDQSNQVTPPELRTLSASQQDSIRSNNMSALQPDIDQNAYQIAKAEQDMNSFLTHYNEASKFGQDYVDKMVAPSSVIQSAKMAVESNPALLSTMLSNLPNEKSRQALMTVLDYSKLKPKEDTVDKNRLLSISEAKDLGLPYGTTVAQAIAANKVPGAVGGGALGDKFTEQNVADFQTSSSAYQNILSVLPPGKTPETLTEQDIEKMSNNDLDTVGKALARIQAPDIARLGTDPGSALDATSWPGKIGQYVSARLSGVKYPASEVLSAIKTAANLNSGRGQTLGVGGGSQINSSFAASTPSSLIPQAHAAGQPTQMQLPNGMVVRLQADGTYK